MLRWLLLVCLLPQVGCSRTVTQDVVYKENHSHGELEDVNVVWYLNNLKKFSSVPKRTAVSQQLPG